MPCSAENFRLLTAASTCTSARSAKNWVIPMMTTTSISRRFAVSATFLRGRAKKSGARHEEFVPENFSVVLGGAGAFYRAAILVTLAFRPRNPSWEALRTTALNDSVSAYEEGGDRQVRQYLMDLENTQHVRAFLFNEQGEEVSRRAAPDWALRIAAGG